MAKNVAFFIRHFYERGIELSTYNYAIYNKKILGNNSIIIAFNKEITDNGEQFVNISRSLFEDEFKIIEIRYIEEMRGLIMEENLTHAYVQSHGFKKDYYKFGQKNIWGNCTTIYHSVFGPMVRQGSSIRCVIGNHLNERYGKKLQVLPYIVNKNINKGNLRNKLNIGDEEIVFGRYGGENTFDIEFVKEEINSILKIRSDITFIFLNTKKFINHKKVLFLPKTISFLEKFEFVNTCDAMIHARKDGETFGLAVAEFSVANKPIITYAFSKDKEHLKILGEKALLYRNSSEFKDIILNFDKNQMSRNEWNAYEKFQPEKVIKDFERICLKEKKIKLKQNILEFINDLPWEIYISLKEFYLFLFKYIVNNSPKRFKRILKAFYKRIKL